MGTSGEFQPQEVDVLVSVLHGIRFNRRIGVRVQPDVLARGQKKPNLGHICVFAREAQGGPVSREVQEISSVRKQTETDPRGRAGRFSYGQHQIHCDCDQRERPGLAPVWWTPALR